MWDCDTDVHAFVDTPEFYQRTIGAAPPIDDAFGHWMAVGMELDQFPNIVTDEEFKRIVLATIDFCDSELSKPKSPYYSSLDADSDGEEGRYYVWTEEEVDGLLSDDKMLNIFKSYYQNY